MSSMTTTKDEAIKTWPARIWLEGQNESGTGPAAFSEIGHEVRWSKDQMEFHDVEYVRADLAATSHIAPDAAAIQAPDCGACPGDGSVCAKACKLADASPAIAPEASELPPRPKVALLCGDPVIGDDIWGYTAEQMDDHARAAIAMHRAAAATEVMVHVDRNRVFITKGVQSFMLAYEADTAEELDWYANQLRKVLASNLAAAEPVPTDLHAAIMNLPCNLPDGWGGIQQTGYKIGHRDARHAAAELVAATKPAASEAVSVPVAWAVMSKNRSGIHKLCIQRDSAERKAAAWLVEWPNNPVIIRPLVFGDAAPAAPTDAKPDNLFTVEQVQTMILADRAQRATHASVGRIKTWQERKGYGPKTTVGIKDVDDEIDELRAALKSSPQAPKTEGSEP